jgi:hypothetical protein
MTGGAVVRQPLLDVPPFRREVLTVHTLGNALIFAALGSALVASTGRAQSAPAATQPSVALPSDSLVSPRERMLRMATTLERFAAERGLGVVIDQSSLSPVLRTRRLRTTPIEGPVPPMSERVQCPMPVAKVDPNTLTPMPVAVTDTVATAPSARRGTIVGCVNPLER